MIPIFAFLLGASIGSFIAARVMRIRLHVEQEPMGRSECMKCHHTLHALDLIPLLSFLFLRGTCRHCKQPFTSFYFFVELLTALLFVLLSLSIPTPLLPLSFLHLLLLWAFGSMMVYISLVDYYLKAFPVLGLSVGTGAFVLTCLLLSFPTGVLDSLWGIIFFAGVLYLTKVVGKLYFKKEAMGEGDLYLAAFLGSFLGLGGSIVAFYIAVLSGACLSSYLLLTKRPLTYLPFAPFLCLGALLAHFYGADLILWYFGVFL